MAAIESQSGRSGIHLDKTVSPLELTIAMVCQSEVHWQGTRLGCVSTNPQHPLPTRDCCILNLSSQSSLEICNTTKQVEQPCPD